VENWKGKEFRQLVRIIIFVKGNIQQVVNGLASEWLETMEEQIWEKRPKNLVN